MLGFRFSVTIITEFLELKQNKMDNVFIKLHFAYCLYFKYSENKMIERN